MLYDLYSLGSQKYFTPLKTLESSTKIYELIKSKANESWLVQRDRIWISANKYDLETPEQGFKIHISSVIEEIYDVIEKVVPVLIDNNTNFKIICSEDIFMHMNSKQSSRTSSGKFITIYPNSYLSFKKLIEDLYTLLKNNTGPYILTDKRYKDSKCVFYRYGGFILITKYEEDGTLLACIKKPDGTLVEDKRDPYYYLPDWVEEPFEDTDTDTDMPLNGRYEIIEAISFSNSGGVYKALDLKTSEMVLIKESRPYVNFSTISGDCVFSDEILKNEYFVIQEMQSSKYFPKAIDFFKEWEHSFLVESFVSGEQIRTIRVKPEITLVPYTGEEKDSNRFTKEFLWISKECINAVMDAHNNNIIISDISSNNILVDYELKKITFIDFDGSYKLSENTNASSRPLLTTPGFGDIDRLLESGSDINSDWYALAMVLYGIIIPVQQQFDFNKKLKNKIIKSVIKDCNLHSYLFDIINALIESKPEKSLNIIKKMEEINSPLETNDTSKPFKKLPFERSFFSQKKIIKEINKINTYINEGLNFNGKEYFLPIDAQAIEENELSLALGYYGPALYISKTTGDVPLGLLNEIKKLSNSTVCSNLFMGYAGMAMAETYLGRIDLAKIYADNIKKDLTKETNNFGYGISGIGFSMLCLYKKSKDEIYLKKAIEIGNLLINRSKDNHLSHDHKSNTTFVGFVHGNSGISLFLLRLYQCTLNESYFKLGKKLLDFDISCGVSKTKEINYTWGETSDSNVILPYWEYGASGIGSVVSRYYEVTQDIKYLDLLKKILLNNYSRYSALQGSFDGLAGLGELFIDVYSFTKDEIYLNSAYQIANSILIFSVKDSNGHIYPGRGAMKLSTDLAYGSSGIGLFLNRLISNDRKRLFHDLP